MTNKTFFAISLAAATAIGSASYAHADGDHGNFGWSSADMGMMRPQSGPDTMGGMGEMMQMMMRMHGPIISGGMMNGMGPTGGMWPMGGIGPMGSMMQMLDANGDGTLTPEEAREQLQSMQKSYDTDGDGVLSIAEFEVLHSSMIREIMVDRFQFLDADGDGRVTADEMTAPADRLGAMQMMRGTAEPGRTDRQPMGRGMDEGSMMNGK